MFVMTMVGAAVLVAVAINKTDQALEGGLAIIKAARKDGARRGAEEYRDGPGKEAKKESFENGYRAGAEDMRDILGR